MGRRSRARPVGTDPMNEPVLTNMDRALLVSAVTGGVVAAIRTRGRWPTRLLAGIGGSLVSYFLSPIFAPIAEIAMEAAIGASFNVRLDLSADNVVGATGFLLGVFGMEALQFVADVLRGDRSLADVRFWRPKARTIPPAA